ncbi:MAG TPA: sulfatase-like hydrolase/transferase [Cyclobacteriaceae bacterium]|nr:sulfatase-like hydrolase/transferase [Cyclobacteriaceae bacterium]
MKRFFKGFQLQGNVYWALVLRLLLAMFLFMLCRIGFFIYNISYFPETTTFNFLRIMWGGLQFDLAAVLYINVIILVLSVVPVDLRFRQGYQSVIKFFYYTLNGIALAANVMDFVYYRFTLRRTTADVVDQFENETNLFSLFLQFFIDYWYAVIFWGFLMWVMVKLYKKIQVQGPLLQHRITYYVAGVLAIPLVITLFIGAVRGGFRHSTRPITLSNAGEYVEHPNEVSLVLNTPFAIFRTLGKTKIQKINFFKDEAELSSHYNPVIIPHDTTAFKPVNVVVIILESFSKEFFGVFNKEREGYQGYTPFLDSLAQHSKTFQYSFANGRKSIDGLPSVMASIPSLGVPYVLTPFASNKINSLGSLLRAKGYHTSFFHGAPNGSMGFQAFTNLAGFEHYYGKTEYNNDDDFDNMWGIWDDKFLGFYADKMNEFPQPFMSSFFSVSSHHPFKVPDSFEGKFKGGEQPILKCIEYTDYSLRQFFKKASRMPWFANTLFVITADHVSSNVIFTESHTTWGLYSVPLIFFKPDNSLSSVDTGLSQQIDIMPSVLGYLHYDKPYVAFGRNVFDPNSTPFAFNYSDNVYNLYKDNYLLMFDGKRTIHLYDFKQDKLLQNDLKEQQAERVQEMEIFMKAIIQQYNNRMVEDKLTAQ